MDPAGMRPRIRSINTEDLPIYLYIFGDYRSPFGSSIWGLQISEYIYNYNTNEETKLSNKYSNGIELTIRCQDHLILQNNI